MTRYLVSSETVKAVGYDPATWEMEVTFKSSATVYRFALVPPAVVGKFLFAPSIGSYFAKNIRGKYNVPEGDGDAT